MTFVDEAVRICPDVWMAEDHGLAFMTDKRRLFGPRYRLVDDEVACALQIR